MKRKTFWTTKNIIFLILVTSLLFIIPKITGILLLFFAAYVIACALNPFVKKLQTKMNRGLATAAVVLGSISGILALFVPIIIVAYKEIKIFILLLPEKLAEGVYFLSKLNLFGYSFADLIDSSTFLSSSSGLAQSVVNRSLDLTMGIAQFLMIIIALLMIVYYILVDKDYLKNKYAEFFPSNLKEKANDILYAISTRVGGYVRAQILSMVAVGVMMTILLIPLGVDYPVLLGLITGLLDIIPILGPAIAVGIILLVAYPFSILKFALIIGAFLLVQQLSNYIVRPILFGKFMALHPLMIFLALFIAQQFLGFWGVILSPAIAATICVLIDELYIQPINQTQEVESADYDQ